MNYLEYKIKVACGLELDLVASIISGFSSEIKRLNSGHRIEIDQAFRLRILKRFNELFKESIADTNEVR